MAKIDLQQTESPKASMMQWQEFARWIRRRRLRNRISLHSIEMNGVVANDLLINPHTDVTLVGNRTNELLNDSCCLVFENPFLQKNEMRLNELIAEIDDLEPAEKLEWLVEFADELPEISPERKAVPFPETCRVQECQTPVHLWVSIEGDRIHIDADVPRKSPTVRGLVAFVVCGLEGASVSEGLAIPDDMVGHLGLASVLGMTRQQGFRGVIARVKRALRGSEE